MRIIILGTPLAKQSFKVTKKGFKYTDKKVVDWKAQARTQLINQLPEAWIPFTEAVRITDLTFVFPILKSFPKYKIKQIKEGIIFYKTTKPDLDNLQKSLWDCCEGILFINDSQVVHIGKMEKKYGEVPRIEFTVERIEQEKKHV